jgi:hypothetical protein
VVSATGYVRKRTAGLDLTMGAKIINRRNSCQATLKDEILPGVANMDLSILLAIFTRNLSNIKDE